MPPRWLQAALLALAAAGLMLSQWVSIAAVLALVAYEALRARQEWAGIERLSKESAAALLKLNSRMGAIERALQIAVGGE